MSEEETKQVWDILFSKLNEEEKLFISIVNNEKNKQQIERLNNIINELEKYLEDYHNNTGLSEYETGIDDAICDTLKKLQELKGSDKE